MIDVRDLNAMRAARPFRVAHRGGVIAPDAPENSMQAIELAAQHGYAMVELDVMEAADAVPILMHNGLYINCGVDEPVSRLDSKEITALCYRASDARVLALEEAIEACGRLGLGVMLDRLQRDWPTTSEMSVRCLNLVTSMIRGAGLASAAVAICDTQHLRDNLRDVALFPVREDDFRGVMAGERIDLSGQFWFGWAAALSNEAVARLHEAGAFIIVSINTFHYPPHAPDILAREDIERLRAAGVEGFQIDSVYEEYFRTA